MVIQHDPPFLAPYPQRAPVSATAGMHAGVRGQGCCRTERLHCEVLNLNLGRLFRRKQVEDVLLAVKAAASPHLPELRCEQGSDLRAVAANARIEQAELQREQGFMGNIALTPQAS